MRTHTISIKAGQLSEDLQQEVLDYIEFLSYKYSQPERNLRHDKRESRRQISVRRIDALREQLFARYGEMPDSVNLIREDRAR